MLRKQNPPLPISLYNAIFSGSKPRALDFDHLLKKARGKTKLQKLGADFREDSLKILLKSINDEAGLHPFGRIMIKEKLVSQLENRLWAEYWFAKYPQILEQKVLPIVLVTGLQRTGTTKMQRLLSGQLGARGLLSWEALYPAPIGDKKETKKRISRTKRGERALHWISPAFHEIHPIHTSQPEEDVLLLDLNFMSSSSEAIMHVPTYAAWLAKQNAVEAYEYEKKLLLLLQWQRSGGFWVLKSPHHLEHMEQFLKVFPDSKTVWMHRQPEQAIPSFLSMLYYSRSIMTKNVDKEHIKSYWLPKIKNMLKSGLAFESLHPEKVMDVYFSDFMQMEKATVGNVMRFLRNNQKHDGPLRDTPSNKFHSKHRYTLKDWEITPEMIQNEFEFYTNKFFTPELPYQTSGQR